MSQAGIISAAAAVQAAFQPNQTINDYDDFISYGSAVAFSKLAWTTTGGGTITSANGTSTNPGLVVFSGGATNGMTSTPNGGTFDPLVLGSGSLNINWVLDLVALSTNTNAYTMYIGLMDYADVSAGTPPINGCYFKYTHTVNSGDWQIVCTSASTSTTANTITVAATGFHNYGIKINAAGTAVHFYINGVEVANSPLSAHIPSVAISPGILAIQSAGSVPNMMIDLFYYSQNLNTPR